MQTGAKNGNLKASKVSLGNLFNDSLSSTRGTYQEQKIELFLHKFSTGSMSSEDADAAAGAAAARQNALACQVVDVFPIFSFSSSFSSSFFVCQVVDASFFIFLLRFLRARLTFPSIFLFALR